MTLVTHPVQANNLALLMLAMGFSWMVWRFVLWAIFRPGWMQTLHRNGNYRFQGFAVAFAWSVRRSNRLLLAQQEEGGAIQDAVLVRAPRLGQRVRALSSFVGR